MNSNSNDHLDGNAAAGALKSAFSVDITTAQTRCAHCGATRHFAESHLYLNCPGLVARCSECGHVLLRLANCGPRLFLDLRGMTRLGLLSSESKESTT